MQPPPPSDEMMRSSLAANSAIDSARLLILEHGPLSTDIWEVPGGDCELTDRTILDSVARVTFEKTGLRLKGFVRQIGDGDEIKTNDGLGLKLNFEIEVAELADVGHIERCPTLDDLNITLNRALHRDFDWTLENDIRDDTYPVVTPKQKVTMLRAFTLRKEDEQEMVDGPYAEKEGKKGKPPNVMRDTDDEDYEDDEDDEEEDSYKEGAVEVKRGFSGSHGPKDA